MSGNKKQYQEKITYKVQLKKRLSAEIRIRTDQASNNESIKSTKETKRRWPKWKKSNFIIIYDGKFVYLLSGNFNCKPFGFIFAIYK